MERRGSLASAARTFATTDIIKLLENPERAEQTVIEIAGHLVSCSEAGFLELR